jgi:hypothetical protein
MAASCASSFKLYNHRITMLTDKTSAIPGMYVDICIHSSCFDHSTHLVGLRVASSLTKQHHTLQLDNRHATKKFK